MVLPIQKKTMGVTIKKAGEAAAKTLQKAAAASRSNMPASLSKQVTQAEVGTALPHRTSQTTSSMPWKGWFARWMVDTVGEERFSKIKNTMYFMPDDIYDLEQSPKLGQQIPISKTDPTKTAAYRTPSPGSQASVRIPEFDTTEDPYDTGYFKRDTRRRYEFSELKNPQIEQAKLDLMDPNDPQVQEEQAKLDAGPTESSQGNGGRFATGPSDFDPTGLRATMSVSWKKMNESLDSHMPDHLPTPAWLLEDENAQEKYVEWLEERNLPVGVGPVYSGMHVPTERRIARW